MTKEVTILIDNPEAIPTKIAEAYNDLPADIKAMSEEELMEQFNSTYNDTKLRMNFWKVVAEHIETGKAIAVIDVFRDVCSSAYFYAKFLVNPYRVAYLMTPLAKYEDKTEVLLEIASSRYMEIIKMDIKTRKKVIKGYNDEGKIEYEIKDVVDPFRAKLVLDTIVSLENRTRGTSVSRNVLITEQKPKEAKIEDLDIKAVTARLKELESEISTSNVDDNSIVVDVEYTEK